MINHLVHRLLIGPFALITTTKATMLCTVIIVCLKSACSWASDFYVAPGADSTGAGTLERPWPLTFALDNPTIFQPGDTIWLRAGRYGTGGATVFRTRMKGTRAKPITLKQFPGEVAIIDGGIQAEGSWTTFWGFEIMNSLTARICKGSERVPGLNLLGEGSTAINLVIHDTGHPGIGFWKTCGDGAEIYGCLIWGTGTYQTDEGWNGRPRGSGIYAQNTEGSRSVSDVISFKNFTTGMKAFAVNAPVNGFRFSGNIVFQNAEDGIFVSSGAFPAERIDIESNIAYNNFTSLFGYVDYPQQDLSFRSNYFVSEYVQAVSFGIWQSLNVRSNTFVTSTRTNYDNGAQAALISANFSTNVNDSHVINNNTYMGGGTLLSPFRLQNGIGVVPFSKWQDLTGWDKASAYSSSYPTTNFWALRANKYERGRAHIAVFNWERADNIIVDISNAGLTNFQAFEIRDVQNFHSTPIVRGRFLSGRPSISLPLNLSACAKVSGSVTHFRRHPNLHTDSLFNCFVILPVLSQPDIAPPSNLQVMPPLSP